MTVPLKRLIHSFIHTQHLHSAPSRKLLGGAPNSSTAKKNGFKMRKEREREGPRNKTKLQRKAIPDSLPPSLPMRATGGTRRLSGGVGLVWSFLYFAMISMTVAKFCGP